MKRWTAKSWIEVGVYGLVALLAAKGAVWIVDTNQPASLRPVALRSAEDAHLIRDSLKLASGTTWVIEFMDFECPPCRATWPEVKKVLTKNPSVRCQIVDFPLPMHPLAFGGAVAHQIAVSGKAGDEVYEDLLFGRVNLEPQSLNQYLKSKALPPLVGTSASKEYIDRIKTRLAMAETLKIGSTPSIMVLTKEGALWEVRRPDKLEDLIRADL